MTHKRTINILILLVLLFVGFVPAWGVVDNQDYDGDGVDETYNVVYINLGSGDNSKAGDSPANAVKSWATAYGKLPKYTGTTDADRDAAWDSNIIVVCDKSGTLNITDANTGSRPATITGVWPWIDSKGNSPAPSDIKGKVNLNSNTSSSSPSRIGADTKFKYLKFGQGFLSMYLHDCTFDVGCSMNEISGNLSAENGALRVEGDVRKAPEFQVFLYANTHVFDNTKPDGGLPNQTKPVTLTIKSGKIGRILTNRITGTGADEVRKRYVMGRPSSPFLCVVNVDIDPNTSTGVWNTRNDVYDIAYLCAGMTQGMVYSDVQFNIKRGTIGTLVAAMQGNSHTATATVGISNSSFFGRTEVNINPVRDEDVTIYRYFATCFGRYTNNAATLGTSNAAFYGKSTLNMHGGTIESGVFATAGGITGLKSPDGAYHTIDQFVPYLDGGNDYVNYPFMGIRYQPYDETGTKSMPTFTTTLHGTPETIDLSETVTEINIHGGTVHGGVFGGGYGFSPEMPAVRAIAGAGSFWGEAIVNIYGGTITGGVYGGGAGASNYFNASTSNPQRTGFSTVASFYGDTRVNIYGGEISGDIYGGGKGLDYQAAGSQEIWDGAEQTTVNCQETEFADVAKVYGNTNVTINPTDPSWTFTGNIYGGGAMGAVEGNTNVQILGGNITGNVFAGGLGEDGHADKAKVTGDTEANIKGGTQGSEYAVYGGAQMAQVAGNTTVNLTGGTVGSAYGGGLGTATMAANITGNTTVTLNGSKVTGSVFGCNNTNGTPSGHAKVHVLSTTKREGQADDEYDVAAVYGGGNRAAYEPTSNEEYTEVLIENCDNSIDYVYGGGNAAPVPATKVTIFGANAINNAFAGGNGAGAGNPGADIGYLGYYSKGSRTEYGAGTTDITVYGGTVNHVYGGSNTLGYICTKAKATITDRPGDYEGAACDLHVGSAMAGGNEAVMYCSAELDLSCSEGLEEAYGGGNRANVYNDIELNITSGTYGKVFGGNNISGNIFGKIVVNIEETGCYPVKIGSLYGCGNQAPYSVYGYDNEGMCITSEAEMLNAEKYADPVINIISCTSIDNIFGGGLGEGATVYGSPTININPVPGRWAEDNTDGKVGTIGTVYGGGDAAAVYGDTHVNIGTEEGDVIINGNVYGGSRGLEGNEDAGKVYGSTHVTIGKEVAQ